MPPSVPRKRLREDSPERVINPPPSKKTKTAPKQAAKLTKTAKTITNAPRKATLFDDLDLPALKGKSNGRNGANPGVSAAVNNSDDDEDDASSLSSLSDDEFEDVPPLKPLLDRKKKAEDYDDEEDIEFEDVSFQTLAPQQQTAAKGVDLTLSHIAQEQYTGGKKGPSKNERRARINTHCMHVQLLMWHNAIRNAWLCDSLVQGIMLSHLPAAMWDEIERWRRGSGLDKEKPKPAPAKAPVKTKLSAKSRAWAKPKKDANDQKKSTKEAASKDWGAAARRLEESNIDLSHGDPMFRLLKALSNWWRQRFKVTAPGLRKRGYMPLRQCVHIVKQFEERKLDISRHGERIENVAWFRLRAQTCCGSRDVGAQLFTALLRAIGLETRMVANLQPVGFGWTKAEEISAHDSTLKAQSTPNGTTPVTKPAAQGKATGRKKGKDADSDSEDLELKLDESDDDSIVEIERPTKPKAPVFDKDLDYANYWAEVLSPVSHRYVPIDVMVKKQLCTNRETVEMLEPRGQKAEAAKQVMAYTVGFSPDGTAKDVTVRYLKNLTVPGRTKGFRMPIEKIPVHNKHGKVKHYDSYDWFRAVMRSYVRGTEKCPVTEDDELEDSTDLKPAAPRKKQVKEGEETLQYYKQSTEYVLERHLKREEAVLPGVKPVKMFKNKGGKKCEKDEEPVYLRSDIAQVKSGETWHKQGRAPKPGERPLKRVPYRVATTTRRRQIAEMEAKSGEKALQGLYSWEQTEWIIPPAIRDGVIPKNEYGNIDLFVEHMLPLGSVHLPYRTAMRVCKRMGIDYAEAVVDFEFGRRMAVPVISGVVIAEEYHDQAMEEIEKEEAERIRKEDEKKRKIVLASWRKLLMGLKIVERVSREHGDIMDDFHAFGHSRGDGTNAEAGAGDGPDEEMGGGGFLPEGFEYEAAAAEPVAEHGQKSAYFAAPMASQSRDDDDDDEDDEEDMLVLETSGGDAGTKAYPTPQSAVDAKPSGRAMRRRQPEIAPPDESSMEGSESDLSDISEDEDDRGTEDEDGRKEESGQTTDVARGSDEESELDEEEESGSEYGG